MSSVDPNAQTLPRGFPSEASDPTRATETLRTAFATCEPVAHEEHQNRRFSIVWIVVFGLALLLLASGSALVTYLYLGGARGGTAAEAAVAAPPAPVVAAPSPSLAPTVESSPAPAVVSSPASRSGRSGSGAGSAPVKYTSAEVASRALREAWMHGSRSQASKAAANSASNALFAKPYRYGAFRGCNSIPEDATFACVFDYGDEYVVFTVGGGASAGYTVTETVFTVGD